MKLNEIIKFCLSFEGAFKRYPFPRGDNPLVMSVDDKKMFCVIYENTDPLHISVKCEPMEADILRQMYKSVKPGYHFNKSHWNSIYIDGSVPEKELKRMIRNSYDLVKKKSKSLPNSADGIISKTAAALGRNDEKPNIDLAARLCKTGNNEDIKEIVKGLSNKNSSVANDCIKVLYEIGTRKPELIADYVTEFLELLSSKNNRLVWGAMTALSEIAEIKYKTILKQLDVVMKAYETGSVITVDNSISLLAKLCKADKKAEKIIFPVLTEHLKTCRLKEVPQHAERMLPCINKNTYPAFAEVLQTRRSALTAAQNTRVNKLLKTLPV